ncbi:Site-specific tyrosine recombinase [Caldisalinibacter kiritimatiensis]|uniref:Site-specific tyrosine recombinase n=1 Tax=Caldisalinibacter kiritimatiensis TaxID=1304284 RepID=R1CKN0_9FIRM|nr:Site-specific tyrosine recombinase [Caldisalinibacter kiritimatiensis]
MTRSGVFRIIKKYAKLAGVEVHPHILRHQFCHDLLTLGESISTVAELAGHSDINTTYRYTLATEKEKREAVEKLTK